MGNTSKSEEVNGTLNFSKSNEHTFHLNLSEDVSIDKTVQRSSNKFKKEENSRFKEDLD